MTKIEDISASDEVGASLDFLASAERVQSNCMFQLAVMMARIALEPCSEAYKEDMAQALMGLIRAKPKSNVVRLFNARVERSEAPIKDERGRSRPSASHASGPLEPITGFRRP